VALTQHVVYLERIAQPRDSGGVTSAATNGTSGPNAGRAPQYVTSAGRAKEFFALILRILKNPVNPVHLKSMTLPEALYTGAQVRELDRRAIEAHGIPGSELMERAGAAAFAALRTRFPRARAIGVVCGPGNNGGDGYVLARLAREAGLAVFVMRVGAARTGGDAARARQKCEAAGVAVGDFALGLLVACDVVVDALFGTGLSREVEAEGRAAIEAMNVSGRPVLALDIPSGLQADSGRVLGAAVRAHATVTFIGLKAGLFTGEGRTHAGEILFDSLGVPAEVYSALTPQAYRLTETGLRGLLPRRARTAHKGEAGFVLVVGGDRGMPGAAQLAGRGALRAGAGLAILATHPVHAAAVNAACPELIAHGVRTEKDLRGLLARATVIGLGPGLGQSGWGRTLFRAALKAARPLVVDADGLNWLATKPSRRDDWILTPHPGEAARLLKMTAAGIQTDRFAAARAIAKRYGGVCVLKGSGTLIASADGEPIELCDRGNPGMASGGMGDVLTGVIAALRAQGLSPRDAACLGVWVHAAAGDDAAAQGGEIGLIASDLLAFVRARLNRIAT